MADDENPRSTTFKVHKDCLGYVEGEEPTIIGLDKERETELLGNGSLKYVSGDQPRTEKKSTTAKGPS